MAAARLLWKQPGRDSYTTENADPEALQGIYVIYIYTHTYICMYIHAKYIGYVICISISAAIVAMDNDCLS